MIKIFRQLRRNLLYENRFRKYLFYAVGEIVLVMIGILLAFQVNSWKDKRTRLSKEQSYLRDIRANLKDDLSVIDSVIRFNQYKSVLSDSMFYTLGQYSEPEDYMPDIIRYMFTLTGYETFEPNKIAFSNMLAAENIVLIADPDLKLRLSQYYKKDFNTTTQESVKQRSRQFGDYVATVSFNRQTIKALINRESQLRDISEVAIHRDPKVYSYLFNMLMTTNSQSEYLLIIRKETKALIQSIDEQIP